MWCDMGAATDGQSGLVAVMVVSTTAGALSIVVVVVAGALGIVVVVTGVGAADAGGGDDNE